MFEVKLWLLVAADIPATARHAQTAGKVAIEPYA